ncbi:MAG TPA: ABC transporter ATP-binding protein [Clostridiales bacterium]|nr:ABC transporter ATP-binding protein [Clostridiales bacterium]
MSIEIKDVSKNFGTTQALSRVNLTFDNNKIYGLLGRNGAGKTTLLNIITNRIFADEGEVIVDGIPSKENDQALQKIYMMSEKNYYPTNMKIKEIFAWTKNFYQDFDMDYAKKLADLFDLNINKNVKSLSTGYTSIFKVIIALSVNTPYVLLDEPVLGLDANHRDIFYKLLIEKYSNFPCTIVISTHLIEEVSTVIEDVIIIRNGTIIKNQSREELLSQGYTISGKASSVDSFIVDKNVIGTETIGGLKSAFILGSINKETIPTDLEVTKLDLQKLFVQLTNA